MMIPILTSEQPPVAHRPALAPHQQYVQWTEHHQHEAQGLPPCAIHLWQYLLYKYPGGVPQEIDLEEIRFELSVGRSKTYCVQSLKNALWKYLVPQGLVAVVKQFTKRILRVVANHAGPIKEIEKRFDLAQSNLRSSKQICQTEPETTELSHSLQSFTENPTPVGEGDGARQEGSVLDLVFDYNEIGEIVSSQKVFSQAYGCLASSSMSTLPQYRSRQKW